MGSRFTENSGWRTPKHLTEWVRKLWNSTFSRALFGVDPFLLTLVLTWGTPFGYFCCCCCCSTKAEVFLQFWKYCLYHKCLIFIFSLLNHLKISYVLYFSFYFLLQLYIVRVFSSTSWSSATSWLLSIPSIEVSSSAGEKKRGWMT